MQYFSAEDLPETVEKAKKRPFMMAVMIVSYIEKNILLAHQSNWKCFL